MIPKCFLSPKTILSLSTSSCCFASPCPYSILISHFSTSSSTPQSNFEPSSVGFRRHHQEELSRNVRVSVWWDFENCNLPAGVNVFKVAHAITAAVRVNGIKGPVQITAFGDILQLSRAKQEALSSTGINMTHVPHGGKNSADRSLLVDLMYWVSQNPPPAHLFLISSDRDFASVLHRLRMNNYNILLASTDSAPGVLCSAASIMWQWNALVRGENLTGRHFNQPPDGPYGSWYGHYKLPLEDPFYAVEQPTSSRGEELSEANSEPKVHPIPKAVVKQICHILSLHPKGMSITELRSELGKSSMAIDKDLYGHKKFSRFLLSMPHILKLQSSGDGQFVVRGITAKAPEPFEPNPFLSTGPVISNGNQHLVKSSMSNGEDITISGSMDTKLSLPSSAKLNVEEPSQNLQVSPSLHEKSVKVDIEQPLKQMEQPPEMEQAPLIGEKDVKEVHARVTEGHLSSVKVPDSAAQVGIFKKIWRRWFGSNDEYSEMKSYDVPKKSCTSGNSSERPSENTLEKRDTVSDSLDKKEVDRKSLKSPNLDNGPIHPVSSSCIDSTPENKTAMSSEPYDEKSRKSPGLFIQIMSWCKFWKNSMNSDTSGDQPSEALKQVNNYAGKPEVFSKDSFWRDMESFIYSQRGSLIISQSRTREHMAQNLQRQGPLFLKSLDESNVLQLVDMLITEKKWVEEYMSEASPFKLTLPVAKDTSLGDSHTSNGLSSIFMTTGPHSDSQRLPEHNGDKKIQNISHDQVSSPAANKKPSVRSRSEILVDCRKLVKEILKEFPEGYNMASFRKLFVETYGYHLDVQKLGYQKLATLLQTMPGVKIESTYIIPRGKAPKHAWEDAAVPNFQVSDTSHMSANSDDELSDVSKKDDDSDSPWEELGPVDDAGSSKKELQSVLKRKAMEETYLHAYPDYESALSDDEFSDSEGESSTITRQEGQLKPRIKDEHSSLLQILDSWYGSKEGDKKKEKSDYVEEMVDCNTNGLQPSNSSGLGTKIETSLGSYGRKQRPQKIYSFVADPVNNKDKLIEGILGNLKKSGDSRMQS